MYLHSELSKSAIFKLIRHGTVKMAGYKKNKIYGLLHCKAGKRMNKENRVFFLNEQEAIDQGYRPCGACLPQQHKKWKATTIKIC